MNFYESAERVISTEMGSQIIPEVAFPQTFYISLRNQMAEIPGKVLLVYANLALLLPFFLLKQRYVKYIASLAISLLLLAWIQKQISIYITLPILFPRLQIVDSMFSLTSYIQYAASALSLLVFTSSIKILLEWQSNQKKTQELERQKITTELQLLKTQLNPHFFFNTLNNLYGLAMENSKHTAKMILRLSDMMSYILYDAMGKDILLLKEIEAITNYIELEKIRYGNRVKISFQYANDLDHFKIPPLLFLPFVENAFKHGVAHATEVAWINIAIYLDGEYLNFKAENSKSSKIVDFRSPNLKGIGLGNVKRRLELLYPDKFELNILEDNEEMFLITLKLKIR